MTTNVPPLMYELMISSVWFSGIVISLVKETSSDAAIPSSVTVSDVLKASSICCARSLPGVITDSSMFAVPPLLTVTGASDDTAFSVAPP